jgi:hypothetical protein
MSTDLVNRLREMLFQQQAQQTKSVIEPAEEGFGPSVLTSALFHSYPPAHNNVSDVIIKVLQGIRQSSAADQVQSN